MAKVNYYGVKVGLNPGIYTSWEECKAQVDGYPNARYKKFKTEEEAKTFVSGIAIKESKATNTDYVSLEPFAFVDGSFNPETGTYGYGGFLFVNNKKYPIQGSGDNKEIASIRNVSGEILGSMAAVQLAEELGLQNIIILYDYNGIEKWVTGEWKTKNEYTRRYKEFMNSENRKVKISFQKVKAHTGIDGNEIADIMAKQAVGISLTKTQQITYDSMVDQLMKKNK